MVQYPEHDVKCDQHGVWHAPTNLVSYLPRIYVQYVQTDDVLNTHRILHGTIHKSKLHIYPGCIGDISGWCIS